DPEGPSPSLHLARPAPWPCERSSEGSVMLSRLVRGRTAQSLMLALSATTVVATGYLATRGLPAAERAESEEVAEAQGLCPPGYELEDPLEVARELNPAYANAHA